MLGIEFFICSFLVGLLYIMVSFLFVGIYVELDIFKNFQVLAGFLTVPIITIIGMIITVAIIMFGGGI